MRTIVLLGLMSIAFKAIASQMIVVVYTTDARTYVYRCTDGVPNSVTANGFVMQRDVREGRVQWHAVGGVAPYTLMSTERGANGLVTVTVMDATGAISVGLGCIGREVIDVHVDCKRNNNTLSSELAPRPIETPKAAVRRAAARPKPPTRTHLGNEYRNTERGTDDRGTGTRNIVSRPERPSSPSPQRSGASLPVLR